MEATSSTFSQIKIGSNALHAAQKVIQARKTSDTVNTKEPKDNRFEENNQKEKRDYNKIPISEIKDRLNERVQVPRNDHPIAQSNDYAISKTFNSTTQSNERPSKTLLSHQDSQDFMEATPYQEEDDTTQVYDGQVLYQGQDIDMTQNGDYIEDAQNLYPITYFSKFNIT